LRTTGDQLVNLRYCACVNKRGHPTNGEVMAGKHRARTTARRHTEAHVLLGTGAITLGLGIALTTGSGVAAADSNNSGNSPSSGNQPPTTTIRTTISAQSVNTSTLLPGAVNGSSDEGQSTSVVTTRDSVVRQQNPAVTGDNNPGPGPTLAETLIGGGQTDQGLGIPGLNSAPQIPFIELGGGGGGLLSKLLGGGLF
jgi:hypothetical protein